MPSGPTDSPTADLLTRGDPLLLLSIEEAFQLLSSIPSRSLPADLRPFHRSALLRLAFFLTHCSSSTSIRSDCQTLLRALHLEPLPAPRLLL